ncbi:hypothetical protein TSA1_15305 [Bradyrhizobium nitroreducens]|uniref:HTH crp-type domain-containing protein n=1 Tax=Bradyrhizobium nitroreducens TaxID=709803 RepID=A0A2M6UNA1_9BRAD|nr:hypothetical protein TSA1_15305 [Bradyrhizobium nitroreducens]
MPICELVPAPAIRNGILTKLSLSDFDSLRSYLQPIVLDRGSVLNEAHREIEFIYFVETGLVSLLTFSRGNILETGLVGRHGAVDASIALGVGTSIHKSVVLMPGKALRVRGEDLQRSMQSRPLVRERLLHYVQSLMIHGAQTALCGVRHELEQRLASWLCLACDALGHETLAITHDHLAFILGLRRPGVTNALMRFEELGLVRKARGVLHVRERRALEQRTCTCYNAIMTAYEPAVAGRSASLGAHKLSLEIR